MQFALLIYDDEASWANLSEEEAKAIMDELWSYTEELKKSGAYVAGEETALIHALQDDEPRWP
jgi:hypothetical protein